MHRALIVRRFSYFLGVTFVCGVMLPGCGEDMSQPKTIIPEQSPAEKAKESQQFFMKGASKKATGGTKR